jgi:exopolysaccharide production protein ExoY
MLHEAKHRAASSRALAARAGSRVIAEKTGVLSRAMANALPAPRSRFAGFRTTKTPCCIRTKRICDVCGAIILFVLFLPLIASIILFLAGVQGRPVFFAHERIGCGGREFRCWKLRTMVVNADRQLADVLARDATAREEWNRSYKLRNDPRVTPLGRVLRRMSLDELPQLYNVLVGDMSLVGPRPIVAGETVRYGSDIHAYYSCRPGITGLWQVRGRSDVSYEERIHYDVLYARSWSLARDLLIIVKTVCILCTRRGAC